jgi:hypothetical protein
MRNRVMAGVCALTLLAASVPGSAWCAGAREQESFADEAVGRMERSAGDVRTLVTRAHHDRDAVASACYATKLTALEITLRKARDERGTLRRASLREDQDAISASSAAIAVLDRHARELHDEATQCMGHEETFVGQTQTTIAAVQSNRLDEAIFNADVSASSPSPSPPSPSIATPAPAQPAAPPSLPFSRTPAPAGSPYTTDATHEASMLAYSADVTLAVYQVDKSLDAVESVAAAMGGYLAQRSDAQVQIRVPRPRFLEALGQVEKLGDVLHRNVSAEDVTDEFVDLGLRLGNARETRDRLAELLKQATVKDAVEIEKELAKVTEVIEQIEGRLKVIRDRVGFSTIAVSLQASAPTTVRSAAILPFAWLDTMGLGPLLNVPKGGAR